MKIQLGIFLRRRSRDFSSLFLGDQGYFFRISRDVVLRVRRNTHFSQEKGGELERREYYARCHERRNKLDIYVSKDISKDGWWGNEIGGDT